MYITVEISYYPLQDGYNQPVGEFLDFLNRQTTVEVVTGAMSTLLAGEYEEVMQLIGSSMKELMQQYPSVFTLKIANACKLKAD